jgi:hypothetical protein
MKITNLALSGLFSLLAISACTNTKLIQTWSDPHNEAFYKDIMVVGISDSEQTRRAYESYFVASFQDQGIESLASYTLINHEDENKIDGEKGSFRAIVESAIKGSEIDAVLVTHLVLIENEEIYRPSLDYQPVYGVPYYNAPYYGSMHGYHGYVTTYVQQPGYYTEEQTYTLESSLYDVKTEELVWTTRSRTFAPDSIDETIKDVSDLIISDLASRKLIQ